MNRMIGGFLVVVSIAVVTGCRNDGWNPEAPFAPSLRPAFGARVTDGQLRIWTGSPCANTVRVSVYFEPSRAELVLTSNAKTGTDLEYITIGGQYPGLSIKESLPMGFDWRDETRASLSVGGATERSNGWGSSTDIAEFINESAQHSLDTYWFQDVGWLNPAEVAAKDGRDFLATCTPDPAKTKKE
ncbi:hypothetical protein BKG83_00770 [Mycobacteroides chelonae]|nr:hypothetical protein BKG83_00770 [Mycobacteroides chelonae]